MKIDLDVDLIEKKMFKILTAAIRSSIERLFRTDGSSLLNPPPFIVM